MAVRRSEIYWVQFDPVKGNEQGGLRPALIVQNDTGNRFSPTTVVVAVTRTIPPQPYPFIIVIESEESGLPVRSAVNCAQIATIQQDGPANRLRAPRGQSAIQPIGKLTDAKMREEDTAIRYNLGL